MKKIAWLVIALFLLLHCCAPKQDAAYFTQLGIDKLLWEIEDPETDGMFPTDAVNYLEKAIKVDSTYALAYAYLPYAYHRQIGLDDLDREIGVKKCREAVKKAKELAPDHSMTLTAEALVTKLYDSDRATAIELFKQAINADPNNTEAHRELGWAFLQDLQYDLALKHAELAVETEPKSKVAKSLLGFAHKHLGNYEQAIETFQDNRGENTNNLFDQYQLAHTLMQVGKFDQAEEVARKNLAEYSDNNSAKNCLAYTLTMNKKYEEALALDKEIDNSVGIAWDYASMGNKEKAYEGIIELQNGENANNGWTSSLIGGIYVALGEDDKAIAAFEKGVNDMEIYGSERDLANFGRWLATEPWYFPIKNDQRFQAIIAQTGHTK